MNVPPCVYYIKTLFTCILNRCDFPHYIIIGIYHCMLELQTQCSTHMHAMYHMVLSAVHCSYILYMLIHVSLKSSPYPLCALLLSHECMRRPPGCNDHDALVKTGSGFETICYLRTWYEYLICIPLTQYVIISILYNLLNTPDWTCTTILLVSNNCC